jgi:hypothetical protein
MVGWSAVVEGKGVLTAAPFAGLFTVTFVISLLFFRNNDRAERHHGGLAHVG